MTLHKTLLDVGLNDKEISIYTSLLKHGKRTPSALSRLTKINRATVYSVAKSLQSKNLVAEDLAGKTRYLVPLPIENLRGLTERWKRDLKEKEDSIEDAIQNLKVVTAEKEYPVPKIRFIQEDDLEKFLYDNTTKWQESVLDDDGIWWGFQDHSFAEHFEKWIGWTLTTKESKNPRYKGQVISNYSAIEKKLKTKHPKNKRNVHALRNTNFTASLWVGGEYIVMIMTRHHPFYLLEINDKLLAENMKEMIKTLWENNSATIE